MDGEGAQLHEVDSDDEEMQRPDEPGEQPE